MDEESLDSMVETHVLVWPCELSQFLRLMPSTSTIVSVRTSLIWFLMARARTG